MAAKPPAKKKPTRKPRRNTATGYRAAPVQRLGDPRDAPLESPVFVDPHLAELGRRLVALEGRMDRFHARLDKMADALAPAMHAWRNIRSRIPRWLLSLGENGEQDTRRRSQDSEE